MAGVWVSSGRGSRSRVVGGLGLECELNCEVGTNEEQASGRGSRFRVVGDLGLEW